MNAWGPFLAIFTAIIVILLPLIPAILIFRIFPDTKVALTGPLANLSVRATGAFAGYLSVVLVFGLLVRPTYDAIQRSEQRPVWTIIGKIKLLNQSGQEIKASNLIDQVELDTIPQELLRTNNAIQLKIPEEETGIPRIFIRIKGFGTNTITLKHGPKSMSSDEFGNLKQDVDSIKNIIDISDSINIKENPAAGLSEHRSPPAKTEAGN